jgi:hypothetical protein
MHIRETKNYISGSISTSKLTNRYKINKIKKLINQNKLPVIKRVENNLNEKKAFELERKLISLIGRKDLNLGPLTNLTDGGEGLSGYKHTEEWKRENSKRNKGKHTGKDNPMYGKKGKLHPSFGKKFPQISEQMKKNNPMKNPDISRKRSGKNHPMKKQKNKLKISGNNHYTKKEGWNPVNNPNKGRKNPEASKRMKKNNPMKNPEIAKVVTQKISGKNAVWFNKTGFSHPCSIPIIAVGIIFGSISFASKKLNISRDKIYQKIKKNIIGYSYLNLEDNK